MRTSRNPPTRDPIAALATASGRGGIGVVRVSGYPLGDFAHRFLGAPLSPRQATYLPFPDAQGRPIDVGIALWFPAPSSFTGEDVLELQGHGGPVVMQLLLSRCYELGARPAEPGEFTRRAFENGQIDLAQAEAVADLIEAGTTQAARSARRALSGAFSEEIDGLIDSLAELRALIEASLDFPEEEIDTLTREAIEKRLVGVSNRLQNVRERARQGRLLTAGLTVVLAGRPNVGKSSLLNALSGEDMAIVTPIAGTTRDALRGSLQVGGIPLHVVDTAGLRETDDEVERIGIDRSWREICGADCVIQILDARNGLQPEDQALALKFPTVPRLVVHNKTDLTDQAPKTEWLDGVPHVWLSAKSGQGLAALTQALMTLTDAHPGEDVFTARERHIVALAQAARHVAAAETIGLDYDLLAEELRLAQRELGRITGEVSADDILGLIFSRFCIGK